MKLLPSLALGAMCLLFAIGAWSAPDPQKAARLLFDTGLKSLRSGAFDEAIVHFESAYALWPNPKILPNIATSLRQLKRAPEAANAYASFLCSNGTDSSPIVEQTRASLQSLDLSLSVLLIPCSPIQSISIDSSPIVLRSAPSRSSFGWLACDSDQLALRLAPGAHRVSFSLVANPGVSFDSDLSMAAGEIKKLEFSPEASPPLASSSPPPVSPPRPSATSAPSALSPPLVPVPSPSSLSFSRSFGAELRADIDARLRGAVVSVGPVFQWSAYSQVQASALIGKNNGFQLALSFFPPWRLRPKALVGLPVFFLDQPTPGLQGSVGLQLLLGSRASASLLVGSTQFLRKAPSYESSAWLVSAGVEAKF